MFTGHHQAHLDPCHSCFYSGYGLETVLVALVDELYLETNGKLHLVHPIKYFSFVTVDHEVLIISM